MKKHEDFQRRKPKQARSQVTYDSILQAAVEVLERCGADGLNTNRVAERAGVSIGTLYQYFPDRHAILLAAARRELAGPDTGFATLQKTLLQALVRAVESLLGRGTVRSRAAARIVRKAVKRERNAGAGRVTSLVEDFVRAWIIPPLTVQAPVPAMSKRHRPWR